MQKAEADRFLSALQDVDTIRKKEKKPRNIPDFINSLRIKS